MGAVQRPLLWCHKNLFGLLCHLMIFFTTLKLSMPMDGPILRDTHRFPRELALHCRTDCLLVSHIAILRVWVRLLLLAVTSCV